jgi:predicted deacetylase
LRVLVSLHDVTPAHQPRLERAERVFRALGLSRITYLLVPNFHGVAPIEHHKDFAGWCHDARPFAVHWALHGHFHLELAGDVRGGLREWLQRRLLTDGEAEFLSLTGANLHDRLTRARASFALVLGREPDTFVAPAWLSHDGIRPVLRDAGIRYTEDHLRIYDLVADIARPCPVITWSARTRLRRFASRRVASWLSRRWRDAPAIRIALHPFDFDGAQMEAAVSRLLETVVMDRGCSDHRELFGARAAQNAKG